MKVWPLSKTCTWAFGCMAGGGDGGLQEPTDIHDFPFTVFLFTVIFFDIYNSVIHLSNWFNYVIHPLMMSIILGQ